MGDENGQRRRKIRRENGGREDIWREGAKGNEAERKTESENTAGEEYRVECNLVETTYFLRLTTNMTHQSAKRTRKDQQK